MNEYKGRMKPEIISVDEFEELPNFDSSELIFYSESGRLTDEDDNDIEDPVITVGMDPDAIAEYEEDDIFVRNFRFGTDYHIHKV